MRYYYMTRRPVRDGIISDKFAKLCGKIIGIWKGFSLKLAGVAKSSFLNAITKCLSKIKALFLSKGRASRVVISNLLRKIGVLLYGIAGTVAGTLGKQLHKLALYITGTTMQATEEFQGFWIFLVKLGNVLNRLSLGFKLKKANNEEVIDV